MNGCFDALIKLEVNTKYKYLNDYDSKNKNYLLLVMLKLFFSVQATFFRFFESK